MTQDTENDSVKHGGRSLMLEMHLWQMSHGYIAMARQMFKESMEPILEQIAGEPVIIKFPKERCWRYNMSNCGICGKLIEGNPQKEYHDGVCKAISVKRNKAKSTLKYRLKLEFPTSHHIIDNIVDNCFNGLSV